MVARSGRQAGVLGSICARLLGLLTQLSIVVDLEDSVHNGIVVEARLIARVVAAGVPGLTDKEAVGRDATDGLQPGMAHGCLHHATENECTGKRVLGDHHGCERGGFFWGGGLLAGDNAEIVQISRTKKENGRQRCTAAVETAEKRRCCCSSRGKAELGEMVQCELI